MALLVLFSTSSYEYLNRFTQNNFTQKNPQWGFNLVQNLGWRFKIPNLTNACQLRIENPHGAVKTLLWRLSEPRLPFLRPVPISVFRYKYFIFVVVVVFWFSFFKKKRRKCIQINLDFSKCKWTLILKRWKSIKTKQVVSHYSNIIFCYLQGRRFRAANPDSYLRGIGRVLKCAQSNTLQLKLDTAPTPNLPGPFLLYTYNFQCKFQFLTVCT